MASVTWQGDAVAIKQVQAPASALTVDGTPANNTFTVTFTDEAGNTIAVSEAGDTNASTTAAALVTAINNHSSPVVGMATASQSSGTLTLTATTAGIPFTAAASITGGGSGTFTDFTVTTANSGPNDWGTAENWVGGAVPVAADTVLIPAGTAAILYGLNQSGVELATFEIRGHGNQIGKTDNGYLQIDLPTAAITVTLNKPSGECWIDFGTTADAGGLTLCVEQCAAASTATRGNYGMKVRGHDLVSLSLGGGRLGFNVDLDGSESCSAFSVASNLSDAYLEIGVGTTDKAGAVIDSVSITSGEAHSYSAVTNYYCRGGGVAHTYVGAISATVDAWGATAEFHTHGSGTLTAVTLRDGATLDNSADAIAKTVTNCTAYAGTVIKDPFGTITWTNDIQFPDGVDTLTFDFGRSRKFKPADI